MLGTRTLPWLHVPAGWFLLLLLAHVARTDEPLAPAFPAADLEFFEAKIRPLLVQHCYECHGAKEQNAELRVDSRARLLKGGDNGPAILPGQPERSRLIVAVGYENVDLQMPPDGKLSTTQIADLTRWIKLGAPWPKEAEPSETPDPKKVFDLAARKQAHWAWQPLQAGPLPPVKNAGWIRDPLDLYVLARLEAKGLSPAPAADRRTLIRRVYFDLIGLPPSPEQVEAFVKNPSEDALRNVVDELLASPHFGERWARHWLDLVRYAETKGHEFDYVIPNAYQYRDYVIRAFNQDTPYAQFVTEHVAGDLLKNPRLNPEKGFNESILGTGFWYLGEEVHSPVDVKTDEAERIDNKLDVLTKTFLGLTVACARCHDHKFDAISTRDYYALSGFVSSASYRQASFETLEHNRQVAEQLHGLRAKSGPQLLASWSKLAGTANESLADYLLAAREVLRLGPVREDNVREDNAPNAPDIVFEDFERETYGNWVATGSAFGVGPVRIAEMPRYQGEINGRGTRVVNSHHTRGGENVRDADAHVGTLTSPRFRIERDYIQCLLGGGPHKGVTCLELLVDGQRVLSLPGKANNRMEPRTLDVRPYRGKEAQLRLVDEGRSGWGNISLDDVVFTNRPTTATDGPSQGIPGRKLRTVEVAVARGLDAESLKFWVEAVQAAADDPTAWLHLWSLASDNPADRARQAERVSQAPLQNRPPQNVRDLGPGVEILVDYANPGPEDFLPDGFAFGRGPVQAGSVQWNARPSKSPQDSASPNLAMNNATVAEWSAARFDPAWEGLELAPGTDRDPGRLNWMQSGRTLRTRTFAVPAAGKIYSLVRGSGHAYAAVHTHRMNNGPLHGAFLATWKGTGQLQWIEHRLATYVGQRVHLEFTPESPSDGQPAEFEVLLVVGADRPPPLPQPERAWFAALAKDFANKAPSALARDYQAQARTVLEQLAQGTATDHAPVQLLLRQTFPAELLKTPAGMDFAKISKKFHDDQDALVASIQRVSHTAPTLTEGSGVNEFVLIRGNTKTPGEVVPRRFLEALSGANQPVLNPGSGRLELAQRLTDPANPLFARVIVNRLWQHLLGRGIVPTVDNFGVLGEPPTHPELLDHLAQRFLEDGGSIKNMLRLLILSQTYQMSSRAAPAADAADPENLLWHRRTVRRLEGEAIRDAMLTVSGRLDRTLLGPSVPVFLTPFMDGRGRPGQNGPLDGNGRRTIYIAVRRNFLSPMMLAFDTPIPFTSMGRRSVSNVPAQALILLNDPFVVEQARQWAQRTLSAGRAAQPPRSPEQLIQQLYLTAYARPAEPSEVHQALVFLDQQAAAQGLPPEQRLGDVRPWQDLCHVLFNLKEFVFLP